MSLYLMQKSYNTLGWHVHKNPKDLVASEALENFKNGLKYIGGTRFTDFVTNYIEYHKEQEQLESLKKKKYVKRERDDEDDWY